MSKMSQLLNELCSYPTEREWFEFKENWYAKDQLGQYISALSNSAVIEGRQNAYFVWGVNNETHDIVGTKFDPNCDVNNEPLKHYLSRQLEPDINFSFEEEVIEGKKVVVLTIPAGQTLEGFFAGESVPVNQKLSEIFLQLHISEKTGRGVPKVVEKYGKDAYEFHENTILVTIPFRWINSVGWNVEQICGNGFISENPRKTEENSKKYDVNTESSPKTREETDFSTLNYKRTRIGTGVKAKRTREQILELIKMNPTITAKELADCLPISLKGVEWQLKQLREQNIIQHIGANKGGHWEIIEKSEDGK